MRLPGGLHHTHQAPEHGGCVRCMLELRGLCCPHGPREVLLVSRQQPAQLRGGEHLHNPVHLIIVVCTVQGAVGSWVRLRGSELAEVLRTCC